MEATTIAANNIIVFGDKKSVRSNRVNKEMVMAI